MDQDQLFQSRSAAPGDQKQMDVLAPRLYDAHREIVVLRFVDDLSHIEIAGLLDIPVGTVKSRLHHALAALRQSAGARQHLWPDE